MLETLFYMTAITLPPHLFAYVPFWNHLRLPKRLTILILAAEQILFMAAFFILCRMGVSAATAQCVAFLIYGPIFFYLIRLDTKKVAFLYIFTTDYLMIVAGTASFVAHFVLHLPAAGWQAGSLILILFLLTMPLMLRYLKDTADIAFELHAPEIWKTVWMLPLFNSIIVFIFTFPAANTDARSLTARILLMVCIFLIYHLLIRSIRQMQNQAVTEERTRNMELVMQVQANQYALMQSRIEDTSRARHDLRHHLRALQGYIDSQDMDALASYIRQYGESLPAESQDYYCKNIAVNAILSFYAEKAARLDINMEISFPIHDKTLIPEPEFCVLLGNLLENALEGCTAYRKQQKDDAVSCLIRVHAKPTGMSMLVLTVDNTAPQPVVEDGFFASSKRSGPGIGTESVRIIARQYNGDARFTWDNGIFYASVMLNPGS